MRLATVCIAFIATASCKGNNGSQIVPEQIAPITPSFQKYAVVSREAAMVRLDLGGGPENFAPKVTVEDAEGHATEMAELSRTISSVRFETKDKIQVGRHKVVLVVDESIDPRSFEAFFENRSKTSWELPFVVGANFCASSVALCPIAQEQIMSVTIRFSDRMAETDVRVIAEAIAVSYEGQRVECRAATVLSSVGGKELSLDCPPPGSPEAPFTIDISTDIKSELGDLLTRCDGSPFTQLQGRLSPSSCSTAQ